MKYGIIIPRERRFNIVDVADIREAQRLAGIGGNVDHGVVVRDHETGRIVSYCCYEFAFFDPPEKQDYFAFDERLVAGPAVVYEEAMGPVDISERGQKQVLARLRFIGNMFDVERQIIKGTVARPRIKVAGDVLWCWPEKAPPGMVR